MLIHQKKYLLKYVNLWWIAVLTALLACGGRNEPVEEPEVRMATLGYEFDQPDKVYVLPGELEEISGLTAVDDKHLLCNEDETGHLYLFDLEKEEVSRKWSWGKDGDYEGVALLGDTAYVLKSNGNLYEVRNYTSLNSSNRNSSSDTSETSNSDLPSNVRRFKTGIDKSCDAEGLSRLPGTGSLLIACKEGAPELRTVYLFNPAQPDSPAVPYLELDLTQIENKLLTTDLDRFSLNLQKLLDPQSSSGILFPSGIAVHPLTQDLYILSSRSRLLVVYSQDGTLKEVVELRHKLFLQPESITFTANADLYIGNEGKGGEANIMKFSYVQR